MIQNLCEQVGMLQSQNIALDKKIHRDEEIIRKLSSENSR
jgi:hypothetical protein